MVRMSIALARLPVARAALVGAVLTLSGFPARAEYPNNLPVDDFYKGIEEFQKSAPILNGKIQESAIIIGATTDTAKAWAEIDELRIFVARHLADNGAVAQLGAKALSYIHDKLSKLSQDSRYKPEERQFLIDQWKQLQTETEAATREVDDVSTRFGKLLQTLQLNEDFIGELIEIRQAEKALPVTRGLSRDIRDTSNQLNKLIAAIKPPSARGGRP